MLSAALIRAFRPALQSTMLGLGGYLVMTGACQAASVVASAIILPRLLTPIETILVQWQVLAAAHASADQLSSRLASLPGSGESRAPGIVRQSAPAGVRIVLRRSGDYARSATRGGAASASSDLRPTAQ
jgi:ABC-type multidrug transport system fused ATPase/permease subunit